MAWVKVGTKSTTNTWGSAPPITCSWTVTAYRDDVTNALKINGSMSITYVSGYFGFSIGWGSWVIDSNYMKSGSLKGTSPSQSWGTLTSTQEWNLGQNNSTSILCAGQFNTTSTGRSSLDLRLTVPTPMLDLTIEEDEILGEEIEGDPIINIQLYKDMMPVYPVCAYPIGTILEFMTDISPSQIWANTTWAKITDVFLLAAGDTYTAGSTGGAETVTLTINTMPAHTHTLTVGYKTGSSSRYPSASAVSATAYTVNTTGNGADKPHDNIPYHNVVAIWERVE